MNGKGVTRRKVIDPEDLTIHLPFHRRSAPGVCSGEVIDIYADFSRRTERGSRHRVIVEIESDVVSDEGSVGIPTIGNWVEVTQ